jgi:O-antigen/teichoic acid export membrane protein
MVVVNAFVNVIYSKKYVRFSFNGINIKTYLKPFFILGSYLLLTSMYTTFNVACLGFATDTVEVGYYSTATKLFTIILSFYSAFTGVMMPRMSALLGEGRIDEFKGLTNKSVELLFAFVIPIIIISEFCAPEIIRIVAGEGYEGSIMPMRIVMPLMLICGYEQILVLQILSPMKKDTAILRNSVIGASVALLSNIILVPLFASSGTAVVG